MDATNSTSSNSVWLTASNWAPFTTSNLSRPCVFPTNTLYNLQQMDHSTLQTSLANLHRTYTPIPTTFPVHPLPSHLSSFRQDASGYERPRDSFHIVWMGRSPPWSILDRSIRSCYVQLCFRVNYRSISQDAPLMGPLSASQSTTVLLLARTDHRKRFISCSFCPII